MDVDGAVALTGCAALPSSFSRSIQKWTVSQFCTSGGRAGCGGTGDALKSRQVIGMRDLKIKSRQFEGIEIVELSGAVDAISFTGLAATLARLIREVSPLIVLDCHRISYIGSAQLKDLLDLARYARARGGDIKCVGVAPTIQQVANLIAMGEPMDCFEALEDALRAFGVPAQGAYVSNSAHS